jgi:hypothetical protein
MKQDIFIDKLISNHNYFKLFAPVFSFAGFSLSNLGDINQDGFDDIVIGSIPYSGKYLTQKTYVIYGRKNSSSTLYLSQITEEEGFVITGGGFMVGGPGDVNGDGIPDIMISEYQHWQGKGNSYIIIYPRHMSSPTTFLPSSQPSTFPSLSPTSCPSLQIQFPTNVPTFQETTEFPVSKDTFPPFLPRTQSPSRAPKILNPSRPPSRKPSTHSPTLKINPPLVSPTRKPTNIPTRRPTVVPSVKATSRSPSEYHIPSRFPSSSPSLTPTESLSTPYDEITIDSAGVYNVSSERANYLISGEGNVEIRRSAGVGKKIYTILPSKNAVTFKNFDIRLDQISLIHFPNVVSMDELAYTTNPLQIVLSIHQLLTFSSMKSCDLTKDNFIFLQITENKKKMDFQLSFPLMIVFGILIGCFGIFCIGCSSSSTLENEHEPGSEEKIVLEVQKDLLPSADKVNDDLERNVTLDKVPSEQDDSVSTSSSEYEGDSAEDYENLSITVSTIKDVEKAEQDDLLESLLSSEDDYNSVKTLESYEPLSVANNDQDASSNTDIEGNYLENVPDVSERNSGLRLT